MMVPTARAAEQFGSVDLGDVRRTTRLARVAASAAMAPAGTVTAVFTDDAERQGAYDFLERKHVDPDALERGVGETLARRCATEERILVPVDGSSFSFVDRTGKRGLGAVGTYETGAVGLKVISALALTTDGVPIGLLRQIFWRRPVQRPAKKRPIDKKETRHGGAELGDRTMLDALVPAVVALESLAGIQAAALAARHGADRTATMTRARAGRSSYVPEDALRGVPDPGAVAMATIFELLAALS